MFFKGSRYEKVAEHEGEDRYGRKVRYKGIREIPSNPVRLGHGVAQGDRLDHLAHHYYKDAERFWRIADANLACWPDDLLEPGEVIAVPPSRAGST
jgi:nucleoid-associated protein YgaU